MIWYRVASTASLDSDAIIAHVRHFLPSLVSDDEIIAFQSQPQFRTVPEMAHVHVLLRPRSEPTARALSDLRLERRLRSPWAEAERLGGRGHEVGF